ncbi:MAG: hypothetical protein K1X48_01450 [Burkholderiaceae bacterium]|nr:hypothetical protein [Burkholderiaceae bacterium]
MIEIKRLTQFDAADAQRLISGYVSNAKHRVEKTETLHQIIIKLELTSLSRPYVKQYESLDSETFGKYCELLGYGFSFGAYEDNRCVGFALSEPQRWNNTLWV